MDTYGWKIKTWNFTSIADATKQREVMKQWIKKWEHKYQIREIYINNAWAVEYRLCIKM